MKQETEITTQEQLQRYMKFSKKELCKMLIKANKDLEIMKQLPQQRKPLICKKGDYLTYLGGRRGTNFIVGEKYMTTWNGENAAGRIGVIGINKKVSIFPSFFFTNEL